MRIRKRFLSLSAPPPSDHISGDIHHRHQLQLMVQHQLHDPLQPSSSDHTTQIGSVSNLNNTKELESERKKEIIKTDDRKESMLCGEGNSHDLVLKGWFDGDSPNPTKKRRGSLGKRLKQDFQEVNDMIEKTTKSKAKNNKNNEKRGNMKMEAGSRCSRVNGRGWRCGQQTLVGYSLCEHHLGKGRLRSMTNVRGRGGQNDETKKPSCNKDKMISIDHDDFKDDAKEFKDWEDEPSTMKNDKRRKVGVVKEKSLSNLLSQTAD